MAHILLVEDSTLVVDALRLLFEESGHRLSVAGSIADAVDLARRERPQVMLLDLGLPDGDGLEVLVQLNAEAAAPEATLALTGADDPVIYARCIALGCREVLVKPVSPRLLLARVEAADDRL